MKTETTGSPSSQRQRRHKHLRIASWASVILFVWFPFLLFFFSWGTLACGELKSGWCGVFKSMPWIGLGFSLLAYMFVLWIIYGFGREYYTLTGETPAPRAAWKYTKQGYKDLDKGHHHHVRRIHRVASVALAGLTAYASFMLLETDTLINLSIAAIVFATCELLNWKTYSKIIKKENASRKDSN